MTNQLTTIEKNAANFLTTLKATLPTYAIRAYRQETFVKSAMIAIVSNEKLQECLTTNEGKVSLVNAMRMAAGTGLSLNPQEGKSALIPYNKKVGNKWIKTAQYQVMKNGLIELALESGKVEFITADTVWSNDVFDMKKTMSGDEYFFSPARTDRGSIDGFFAAIMMKDGKCHTVYMADKQMQAHREAFSDKTTMPIEGYGQKTVLKRLLNNLHISAELSQAVGSDNASERDIIDITPEPAEKGTSADDLQAKLTDKKGGGGVVDEPVATPEKTEKNNEESDSVI